MSHVIRRTATAGAVGVTLAGASLMGLGGYFVRQILTPAKTVAEDETVLAVDADTITLRRTPASTSPGRYSLYWQSFSGHARIGQILHEDDESVTREVLAVDFGQPTPGPARLSSYFYPAPSVEDGTQLEDMTYDGALGTMPGWVSEPAQPQDDVWAVLVHGRGAFRAEALRAVPLLHDLGLAILVPGYRNDVDTPPNADGRYHLGLSEWRDIEASLAYAVERGAQRIVLFGWSMGGAIVLQLLDQSAYADKVVGVVLDAPVVSWRQVIDSHAAAHRLPLALSHAAQRLVGQSWSKSFGGVSMPLSIPHTDWIARADELRVPTLLIHSVDDDFVPYEPSRDLAEARPDVIQLETWHTALHCREWNVDPQRWRSVVETFVRTRVAESGRGADDE
ncbi:alpha/beta fold hydrolase [Allobranchiibius sp. GilTou38]|uniref:alpha/beta hydrolase family protein n=1 Tax=Allobranchiibius sp. GilTou38 TaxID=2815210 RepID=UPI0032614981